MSVRAVDIGNTTIKISGCEDSREPKIVDSLFSLEEFIGAEKEIAFCTTRNLTEQEWEKIRREGWWELKAGVPLPIVLNYGTQSALGSDRIAASVGARSLFPDDTVLTADIGTALTLDLLSATGEFLGGNISPGIQMRFDALHEFTSRLPKVSVEGEKKFFGSDTDSAIRSGVVWGVVNEIVGAACIAQREYGCNRLLLTGGGAGVVAEEVAQLLEGKINVTYVSDLVLRGIKEAYTYNHDKK